MELGFERRHVLTPQSNFVSLLQWFLMQLHLWVTRRAWQACRLQRLCPSPLDFGLGGMGESRHLSVASVHRWFWVQLDCERAEGPRMPACTAGLGVLGAVCPAHHGSLPATGLVKDAARPAYWVPDHEILHCHNCRKEFSVKLSKHHCRACGQGFCDECSHDRRAVPSRGWDHPVRVCFNCNKKPGDL